LDYDHHATGISQVLQHNKVEYQQLLAELDCLDFQKFQFMKC